MASASQALTQNGRQQLARMSFNPFGSLHREIDRLFEEFTRGPAQGGVPAVSHLVPNIDIVETDKEIQISAEMPGLERKDVEISLEDNMLTVRGEKKVEDQQKDKNVRVSERTYGVFMRVLELPPGIDPSQIQATMSNGVLKITIPKPDKPQPKRIEVKEAS
jgi:HSP20 family protein